MEQDSMQPSDDEVWHYVFRSDPGRVRELNEDSCLCDPGQGLWIVADGMGGHSCGEVASRIAVKSLHNSVVSQVDLSEAIQTAHHDILRAVVEGDGADGMGTTVVALKNTNDRYQIAWVGDSRAYLWHSRLSQLEQLSQDHSLVERLLSAGLISKDEAKVHPQRHLITQCLGSKELTEVKVDAIHREWEPEQLVLLCSDGLTEELTDDDMKTIFSSERDLDKIAKRLMRMALNKGGQDNISFILIQSPTDKPVGFAGMVYEFKNRLRKVFRKK